MRCAMGCAVWALVAAVAALEFAEGLPLQYEVLGLNPDLQTLEAFKSSEARQGLGDVPFEDDSIMLVPLVSEPLAVEDEGDDAALESLVRMLGFKDSNERKPIRLEEPVDDPVEDSAGDRVVVLRLGRGLKSVAADGVNGEADDVRESRVLEEDDDVAIEHVESGRRRRRSAMQVTFHHVRRDADDAKAQSRADGAGAGPLQGIQGAAEESQMVVGTFQAMIVPGSAASGFGEQIQGFMSQMPQIPQLPGGG